MRHSRFTALIDAVVDHLKGLGLALVAIVSILGVIVGYKYYTHTQNDPEFCMSCHMMKEAFHEWERGKHRNVVCQECHQLSILEQNRLLVAFVVKGNQPLSQSHGREKPWKACMSCHKDEITQGSWSLTRLIGHARHVVMQKVECKICHSNMLHDFVTNENACKECHQDKGVHGIGMEAFSCLKCHSFSEKAPSMVSRDRCVKCHRSVPEKGPMSGLLCHQCHKPHGRVTPSSDSCAGKCHGNESSVGQHGLHLKQGLQCLDCHRAHRWAVGEKDAKTLCSRCHPAKDPKTFIY